MTWDVYPVNDLVEHEESDDCPCGPDQVPSRRDDGSIEWVATHHVLDGRS